MPDYTDEGVKRYKRVYDSHNHSQSELKNEHKHFIRYLYK